MSKRYGRNQKRKAKAEMSRLKSCISARDQAISVLEGENSIAKRIITIAREVCPNSIVFEPAVVGDIWHVAHQQVETFDCRVGAEGVMKPVQLRSIDLYQLEASMEEGDFKSIIHFEASLMDRNQNGRRCAYRVSKEAFDVMDVQHITEALAHHLKQADNY